jgi:hypothetical protein
MHLATSSGQSARMRCIAVLLPCMLVLAGTLHAQALTPNIALQSAGCICTHSGGGSGTYGPEQYNDGIIPTCGSLPWGWTSTGGTPTVNEWIQFDWGTVPKTFDEITFRYADVTTRYMSGATIQIWNGATWVSHHTFTFTQTSPLPCDRVVPIPIATTTRMRIAALALYNLGQNTNPNFREIEIRNSVTAPNDAGVASVDSPLNFCAGTYPIAITLQNFGSNQITSVNINWSLNGVPQAPVAWTGLLDTLNSTTRRTSITLHPAYSFSSGVPYAIKAWTSMPNNVADTVNRNDTISVTRQAALAGTFTVGGTAPDFPNLNAAIDALHQFGVCGPVVVNIRSGVYTEQMAFGNNRAIAGQSAVNTVTFQSETRNRGDVTVTFTSTTGNPTLYLNAMKFMTFRDMTITAANPSYSIVTWIQGGSENITLENLNLIGQNGTSTSTNNAVIYSPSGSLDHNLVVRNCLLRYGSYSMYLYGSGTTALENNVVIENNTMEDFYYMGLYMWYLNAPIVDRNVIRTTNTYTNYMMYTGYCQNAIRFTRNTISAQGTSGTKYGMYIYYCTATSGNEGIIANNFIAINGGTGTVYGLYPYYSNYQNIDYNTVNVRGTYTLSCAVRVYGGTYYNLRNNIYTNTGGGLAAYYYYATNYRAMNHNVFFTSGPTLAQWTGANQVSLANLQTVSLMEAQSIQKSVTFANITSGDLHLAGTSQNDIALTGQFQPEIAIDIDGDPRVVPYRGADEACYILQNTVTYRFVDGENQDVSFATIPGTINVAINVSFPDMGFPLQVTVNFYTVPGNQLAYTTSFSATKLPGQTLSGTFQVAVPPTLQPGYYRMNVVFNTQNSCGDFINYVPGDKGLLLVGQGQTPCIVWPGDVTNDGIVNYGDRAALNKYIFNANLRASWLTGPARYRADAATNPMTYFTWEGQAGAPWATPEGCYMDADGNGMVNNWDLLPVKVNFLRTNGSYVPKHDETSIAGTFGMTQNYPNPFNPSTTLQYAVPEKSTVKITVTDMIGRVVAVLVDGEVEAGVRTVVFDASALENGVYMARFEATGIASGIVSSRIVKMTLAK